MSTQLMVDTEKLKTVASRLDNIMSSVRANVKTAKDAVMGLEKGWTGDAKNEFFRQVNIDLEAMSEMEEQYGEITRCLQELLTMYDNTENESSSSMQRKKR